MKNNEDCQMFTEHIKKALPIIKALNVVYGFSRTYHKDSELAIAANKLIAEMEDMG